MQLVNKLAEESIGSLTNSVGSYLWLESIELHRHKTMFMINYNFIDQLIQCTMNKYGTPLAQRASYFALHSSHFGQMA